MIGDLKKTYGNDNEAGTSGYRAVNAPTAVESGGEIESRQELGAVAMAERGLANAARGKLEDAVIAAAFDKENLRELLEKLFSQGHLRASANFATEYRGNPTYTQLAYSFRLDTDVNLHTDHAAADLGISESELQSLVVFEREFIFDPEAIGETTYAKKIGLRDEMLYPFLHEEVLRAIELQQKRIGNLETTSKNANEPALVAARSRLQVLQGWGSYIAYMVKETAPWREGLETSGGDNTSGKDRFERPILSTDDALSEVRQAINDVDPEAIVTINESLERTKPDSVAVPTYEPPNFFKKVFSPKARRELREHKESEFAAEFALRKAEALRRTRETVVLQAAEQVVNTIDGLTEEERASTSRSLQEFIVGLMQQGKARIDIDFNNSIGYPLLGWNDSATRRYTYDGWGNRKPYWTIHEVKKVLNYVCKIKFDEEYKFIPIYEETIDRIDANTVRGKRIQKAFRELDNEQQMDYLVNKLQTTSLQRVTIENRIGNNFDAAVFDEDGLNIDIKQSRERFNNGHADEATSYNPKYYDKRADILSNWQWALRREQHFEVTGKWSNDWRLE